MFNLKSWFQGVVVFGFGLFIGMVAMTGEAKMERQRIAQLEAQLANKDNSNQVANTAIAAMLESCLKQVIKDK